MTLNHENAIGDYTNITTLLQELHERVLELGTGVINVIPVDEPTGNPPKIGYWLSKPEDDAEMDFFFLISVPDFENSCSF